MVRNLHTCQHEEQKKYYQYVIGIQDSCLMEIDFPFIITLSIQQDFHDAIHFLRKQKQK